MSDFTSNFWHFYIAIITVGSIVACVWLLVANLTRKQQGPAQTMGHVWDDDLAELNNPLPAWWAWLFVITIVFSAVYLVLFPGLGAFKGVLGWSSTQQYVQEQQKAAAKYDPLYRQFAAVPVEQLAGDERARAIGERLFLNNCSQCHSSDAKGSRGYPNLADKDWLWGGQPANIQETIMNGRHGQMPALGEALGGDEAVDDVAHYVLSLSDSRHDTLKALRGKAKFSMCVACHGADGRGNPAMGAPNLTDKVWLHGGTLARIRETISKGRNNQMPGFAERLGQDKVHLLAAYVWGLSNAPQSAAAAPASVAPAVAASAGVASAR